MRRRVFFPTISTFVLLSVGFAHAEARTWKDKSGIYSIEGELFAFNDEHVVIERSDGQLGMFRIDIFSDDDVAYLKQEEVKKASRDNMDREQAWEMANGTKVFGTLVDFARKKVQIQRRRGKIYINDRVFDGLPPVYQTIVIQSVGQYEGIDGIDQKKFIEWVGKLRGAPKEFDVDGIVMQLKDSNEYIIPFVLFAQSSLDILQDGWHEWLAANDARDYDSQDDESFRLQATAAAIARNQQLANGIAVAQFNLDLIRSGITSLWEVSLYPLPGNPMAPRWVYSQGRNSLQATNAALQANPGFQAGPVRRIR